MSEEQSRPSRIVRLFVSMLIAIHLAFVAVAATGAASGRFAPPPVLAEAASYLRIVLQPLMLNNPYRFFAPNPGVDPSLWVRVHTRSGPTYCLECPQLRNRGNSITFLRDFSVPRALTQTIPNEESTALVLAPGAARIAESVSRHLIGTVVPDILEIEAREIRYIDLYVIDRTLISPLQLREGWHHADLRLLQAGFAGRYGPEGERIDSDPVNVIEMTSLTAAVIEKDITPHVTSTPEIPANLEDYRAAWPTPVEVLITDHPQLLKLSGAELLAELQTLVPAEETIAEASPADVPLD